MLRLSEMTGLTATDLGEILGLITGFIIFAVFAGNVLSWVLKEFIDLIVTLIELLFDLIKKHIVDKRKKKIKD